MEETYCSKLLGCILLFVALCAMSTEDKTTYSYVQRAHK